MPSLTQSEYQYALEYLRNDPKIKSDPNIVDVGIGSGLRQFLRQDSSRELCICFYVKKKQNSKSKKSFQIKKSKTISVPLNKSGSMNLSLPCDVVEVNTVKPSGRFISENGNIKVTTGSVIKWEENRSSGTTENWGVITVAHGLKNLANNQDVEILASSQPGSGTEAFEGTVIVQSDDDENIGGNHLIDAAIIDISVENIRANGLHEPRLNLPFVEEIVPLSNLRNLDDKKGDSHPDGQSFAFTLGAYLGDSSIISDLGTLADLFHASSHLDRGFEEGRSGSIWRIDNRPAFMQIGADSATFNEGYGQSLETIFNWCNFALRRIRRTFVNGSLKYVRSF
ncbi:hypothetical protein [Gimesia aquarii]|uniref:Uncharacterized protein n=1 Tax=Gimesia aquarii TaxID=2527964 RepID=A0A517WPZ6_9PLAN|nr:hypothetical protein [Gimesia aquarii]QDU07325.1 hypothetical protein V202x_06770 [Gimesia aquarii]